MSADKPNEHLIDLERIVKGVNTFANMSFPQIRERYEKHDEDKLCDLARADGKGMVLCTRDAMEAVFSMARRHVATLDNGDDFLISDVAEGIRRNFLRVAAKEPTDEAVIICTLAEATAFAESSHAERTFHFPCVLVSSRVPEEFEMGPVSFRTLPRFMESRNAAFGEYVAEGTNQQFAGSWVKQFESYGEAFGWVASVSTSASAPSVGQARAEQATTAAINIIRLFMGAGHARDMRLAHSMSSSPANYHIVVEGNGKLDICTTRKMPGALVEDNWYTTIRSLASAYWSDGSRLLLDVVRGKLSEMASRVVDSLSWYGEATFENASGKQIAKFDAALERLTVTGSVRTPLFCARVALLTFDGTTKNFESCFWKAFEVHTSRSQVVHGILSPSSPVFLQSVRLAHEVTRTAIFRGLELHRHLDRSGTVSTLKDLDSHFNSQLSPHAQLYVRLKDELRERQKQNR
jgi:hypothetical protein